MDRDEMGTPDRGPPIDASYKVSVHLAKRFQRRRLLKIGQSETRIDCSFRFDPLTNMAATGNFCFRLVDF
jgi:hypothetical protein